MSEKLNTLRFAAMAVAVIIAAQGLSRAQGLLPYNPEDSPTWISTEYFGPNAFPVPDMVKSTTGRLEVEFNGTAGFGYISSASTDRTQSVDFRARIPLWTDRVNSAYGGRYTNGTRTRRRCAPSGGSHRTSRSTAGRQETCTSASTCACSMRRLPRPA